MYNFFHKFHFSLVLSLLCFFNSVDSPLIGHKVISFGISVDRGTKLTCRLLYPDIYRANFDYIKKILTGIDWKVLYNKF